MKGLHCGGLLMLLLAINMYAEAGKIIDPMCTCTCPPNYQPTTNNKCECVASAPCPIKKQWNGDTCKCECSSTEEACNANQRWNSQTCCCDCPITQTCSANKVWNGNTCTCECRSVQPCGPNQHWNSQMCSCVCDVIDLCSGKQVWNSDTCSCKCPPDSCPPGSFVIPDTCKCFGGIESK